MKQIDDMMLLISNDNNNKPVDNAPDSQADGLDLRDTDHPT